MDQLLNVEKIIVHHSERDQDCMEYIKVRHKEFRKWEDIGYHFIIEKNGTLKKGRDEKFVGAHVLGQNRNSIGVCLVGNLDKNLPTKKQIKTLIKFLRKKMKEYNLSYRNILGHKEFLGVTKTCPGKNMCMKKLRSKLK